VLSGDARAIRRLQKHADDELKAAAASGSLTLTAAAVWRVLTELSAGVITPEEAGAWASYIFLGYVAVQVEKTVWPWERAKGMIQRVQFMGRRDRIAEVAIEYEPEHQNAIATAIFRLQQIDRPLDGEVGADELRELADELRVR
jgi:hypothetical protein